MVKVWVLTLLMSWHGEGGSQIQEYSFLTRDECIAAQSWYSKKFGSAVDLTTCYPSYK